MTKNELVFLQRLPLHLKIAKSQLRIKEYANKFGSDGIYVSFSGGLDSTVLLHLVRGVYPDVSGVFSNTGLEWPEIVEFVKQTDNIETIRPKDSFKKVIEEDGYPVVNKRTSMMIERIRSPLDQNIYCRRLYLDGIKQDGAPGSKSSVLAKKWRYLLNAPFKISEKCCDRLKKKPLQCYTRRSKKKPIIGVMADEGGQRVESYLKTGCVSFNGNNSKCKPLGFWTRQDVLEYILRYNIPYCSIYGEVKRNEQGLLYTTGEQRTGCLYCAFGIQSEQCPNRYQRLEKLHPELHDYCMNKLGFKEVMEYMQIPYRNEEKKK